MNAEQLYIHRELAYLRALGTRNKCKIRKRYNKFQKVRSINKDENSGWNFIDERYCR